MPREIRTEKKIVIEIAEEKALRLAKEKYHSSGISDQNAGKLKFRALLPEDTADLAPNMLKAYGLKLPYFDLDGKPTDFYRVRYLGELPGFAGAVEKPQRYVQPIGTVNEVYLPPLLPVSWRDIAEDPEVTIYITEGELKAACACANDLACIGLGGVDVWRATKRMMPLLPTLKEIKWKGRNVVIVYDSDAATNPNVVRAQRQLAAALLVEGARPAVASLPPAKDGSKQGLDDFLVAHGKEALFEILKDAPPYPEAEALWELNEEVLFVRKPGIVVERVTGESMNHKMFTSAIYANRHYQYTEVKGDRVVIKKKALAPRWLEWEHRFEVEAVTYAPGRPRLFDGRWNCWPGWGCEPKKGDISPWKWLLDYLFKDEIESREWFEKWCAYPLQHPGVKLYTSAVIWGRAKGTGKTAVAYALKGIYGPNAIEIKNKDLRKGFNAWQQNRQFIYGDEIAGADAGSKRIDAEWLKGLITQNEVTINQKYMPEYTIPDVMNYLFTSNQPDAFFLEDGDRRFFVHEVIGEKAERKFYERVDKWLNGDQPNSLKGPGPAALFDYLLSLDLTGFNPREQAPVTKAKVAMTMDGKSDVGAWVALLKEDPTTLLAPLGVDRAAKDCALFTPGQLLHCYDPDDSRRVTANGLGRELKRAGFRQVNGGDPVRVCGKLTRLYAVRDVDYWAAAKPTDLTKHFERYFNGEGGKL